MKTVKNRICRIYSGNNQLSLLHPGILVQPVIAKLIVGEAENGPKTDGYARTILRSSAMST